ncbi:MAG: hypothetical protein MUP44_06715 [Anaerolineales bacterium]|nr:hypothetical protein [Anaerolineales bacterium]
MFQVPSITPLLFPLIFWVGIYSLDNALTIWTVQALRQHPFAGTITFEGSLELNPIFEAEVEQTRRFGPRFRLMLIASSIYLALVWYFSNFVLGSDGLSSFDFGALFLLEAAVIIRHLQNVAIVRAANDGFSLQGTLHTPRPVSLRMSAAYFFGFASLFLVLGILTRSWFILGGFFACVIQSFRNSRQARAAAKAIPVSPGN